MEDGIYNVHRSVVEHEFNEHAAAALSLPQRGNWYHRRDCRTQHDTHKNANYRRSTASTKAVAYSK